ncbi:MAG: hypothetical protein MK185_06530 [Saccharospirillaceae bacterium]|nr:hypothetical protein [Saccharospirillaceae bacterium]
MNDSMQNDQPTLEEDAIYSIDLVVEFLPGHRIQTQGSVEFSCSDVASASLAHVQKTYPSAQLRKNTFIDPTTEMRNHFKVVEQRTEQLRKSAL